MPSVTLTNVRGQSATATSLPELNHLLRRGFTPDSGTVTAAAAQFDPSVATQGQALEQYTSDTLKAAFVRRGPGPGAARIIPSSEPLVTAGTYTVGYSRKRFVPAGNMRRWRVAFPNFYNNGGVETDGADAFTVRAAVEYPVGVFTPLFFGGKRDVTIEPGALVWTDETAVHIPAGVTAYLKTYLTAADTTKRWPVTGAIDNSGGEHSVGAASGADLTMSTTSPGTTNGFGYAPCGVQALDVPASELKLVGVGDSLVYGYRDTNTAGAPLGWWGRAFDGGVARNQRIGFSSEKAQQFADPNLRRRRWPLIAGGNVGICGYGVNDLGARTLPQIQADLQTIWALLADAGMRVFQTTITPRTTSTDSWATTGGQAVTVNEAVRVALNEWIRSTPAGLTGYLDMADACETGRNFGIWKVNGTANWGTQDGTHPSVNTYPLMAAVATAALPTLTAAV